MWGLWVWAPIDLTSFHVLDLSSTSLGFSVSGVAQNQIGFFWLSK